MSEIKITARKVVRGTSWLVISDAGYNDGHRYWWCVCQCRIQEGQDNHDAIEKFKKKVRENHLRAGKSRNCGCGRTAVLTSIRQGRRRGENQAQVQPVQLDAKPILILEGINSSTASTVPCRCPHGVQLTQKELTSGVVISAYCTVCTPAVPRNITYVPGRQISAWSNRLKRLGYDENQGMSPLGGTIQNPDGKTVGTITRGKNLVLVGGSYEADQMTNASNIVNGGRKKRAAGQDKIKPGQNPNVDFDTTADSADSPPVGSEAMRRLHQDAAALLPKLDDQRTPISREPVYSIRKMDSSYEIVEAGKPISTHTTLKDARAQLKHLRLQALADSREDVEGAAAETCPAHEIEPEEIELLLDEEAVEKE